MPPRVRRGLSSRHAPDRGSRRNLLRVRIIYRPARDRETRPLRNDRGSSGEQASDPERDIRFVLDLRSCGLFDYGKVWGRDRPGQGNSRFKVDGAAGGTVQPDRTGHRLPRACGTLLPCPAFAGPAFRPYAEAGIGVISTDFQVRGPGAPDQFQPPAGPRDGGRDGRTSATSSWRCGLHHLSNGGLHAATTGASTPWILQIGRYF